MKALLLLNRPDDGVLRTKLESRFTTYGVQVPTLPRIDNHGEILGKALSGSPPLILVDLHSAWPSAGLDSMEAFIPSLRRAHPEAHILAMSENHMESGTEIFKYSQIGADNVVIGNAAEIAQEVGLTIKDLLYPSPALGFAGPNPADNL